MSNERHNSFLWLQPEHCGAVTCSALSVPSLAPIIHGHPPGVLPTGMAIEEQKVAAQPMPRGRYSAFAA